jgi:hypothetical protein
MSHPLEFSDSILKGLEPKKIPLCGVFCCDSCGFHFLSQFDPGPGTAFDRISFDNPAGCFARRLIGAIDADQAFVAVRSVASRRVVLRIFLEFLKNTQLDGVSFQEMYAHDASDFQGADQGS